MADDQRTLIDRALLDIAKARQDGARGLILYEEGCGIVPTFALPAIGLGHLKNEDGQGISETPHTSGRVR